MKVRTLIVTGLLVFKTGFAAEMNSVQKLLPNIQDRVRQCSILPYVMGPNQVPVHYDLRSHCPEVKVLPRDSNGLHAKVRVAGHQFVATLVETAFSDGDFYDVTIQDLLTGDQYRLDNVLAYGDILRGLLEGRTDGIDALQLESFNR